MGFERGSLPCPPRALPEDAVDRFARAAAPPIETPTTQARMNAEGRAFLDRKTRSDIRQEPVARMLPQMPPRLRGIPAVVDEPAGIVCAVGAIRKWVGGRKDRR